MERAFTPPLLARMGEGSWPDPSNITSPVMTAFNDASWQAATKQLSAHPMGGLRFSSIRSNFFFSQIPVNRKNLNMLFSGSFLLLLSTLQNFLGHSYVCMTAGQMSGTVLTMWQDDF